MPTTSPPAAVAVLDSAVTWTHDCLQLARSRPPTLPTPCEEWDLGRLLAHMDDSLAGLAEAAELGRVVLDTPSGTRVTGDLVDRVVQRACRTRAAWHARITSAPVSVGDLTLGRDTVVLVGALEIAVHGWDVARSCGADHPIPEDLAARLLGVAALVVGDGERARRFGPRVTVDDSASAGSRLLAHLGRADSSRTARPA